MTSYAPGVQICIAKILVGVSGHFHTTMPGLKLNEYCTNSKTCLEAKQIFNTLNSTHGIRHPNTNNQTQQSFVYNSQ